MAEQAFVTKMNEGFLTIIQRGGAKLTRSEAIALCRDLAAIEQVPCGSVRLRTDYTLLDDAIVARNA